MPDDAALGGACCSRRVYEAGDILRAGPAENRRLIVNELCVQRLYRRRGHASGWLLASVENQFNLGPANFWGNCLKVVGLANQQLRAGVRQLVAKKIASIGRIDWNPDGSEFAEREPNGDGIGRAI